MPFVRVKIYFFTPLNSLIANPLQVVSLHSNKQKKPRPQHLLPWSRSTPPILQAFDPTLLT